MLITQTNKKWTTKGGRNEKNKKHTRNAMAPSRRLAMGNAAGGWNADGDHHRGPGADRTDPAGGPAGRERNPAVITTSSSYQTEKKMSIIPGETGENFMNDAEKELEKIVRILKLMNREQLHLLYLASLQML